MVLNDVLQLFVIVGGTVGITFQIAWAIFKEIHNCLFPRSQTRKGGCIMVLNDVLQLFVIVGGTVGITFQIAWAIFKEIHNNKK